MYLQRRMMCLCPFIFKLLLHLVLLLLVFLSTGFRFHHFLLDGYSSRQSGELRTTTQTTRKRGLFCAQFNNSKTHLDELHLDFCGSSFSTTFGSEISWIGATIRMASMSRVLVKDCNFLACHRSSYLISSRKLQSAPLDVRAAIQNARSLAIQCEARNSIIALKAPPRNSHVLCKATTNATDGVPESTPSGMSQYEKVIETLTTLFPVWVILGTVIGIYKPSAVTWLQTDLFTVGLGFLMLSMGLTLTFEDFRRCLRNPWTVGVGFLAEYLIKPLLGYAIARVGSCGNRREKDCGELQTRRQ